MVFDWSKPYSTSSSSQEATDAIKWAAFYSDCEHEVLEVRSGHRITLTYNLYVTRGSSLLAGHCFALDPTQLPLYNVVNEMINAPGFMKKGELTFLFFFSHSVT